MIWTMTVSSKGQITLPRPARERLGVGAGDKIVLIEHGGRFELEGYGGDILRWYGAFKLDEPQDWAALRRQATRPAATEASDEPESD